MPPGYCRVIEMDEKTFINQYVYINGTKHVRYIEKTLFYLLVLTPQIIVGVPLIILSVFTDKISKSSDNLAHKLNNFIELNIHEPIEHWHDQKLRTAHNCETNKELLDKLEKIYND